MARRRRGPPVQLELRLPAELLAPCSCCEGARELVWDDPPLSAMDPMPCPLCRERDWYAWDRNPHRTTQHRCKHCSAPIRSDNSTRACTRCAYRLWFHEPERVGQLGLGFS